MEQQQKYNIFQKISDENKPTSEVMDKNITIDIVGNRCLYLNDYRIWGGKPYYSENLPTRSLELTMREAMEAFSIEEMQECIKERLERDAFYHGMRSYMNGIKNDK